ncbi:hypothetical protein [Apibacter mensalis]|nr:hypothetical protein [Apibacter mensalis]
MIINVYSSGMYDVVDKKLNPVNENTVDFSVIKDAVIENSRFYHTSKK